LSAENKKLAKTTSIVLCKLDEKKLGIKKSNIENEISSGLME
jgi:hypothetical protein